MTWDSKAENLYFVALRMFYISCQRHLALPLKKIFYQCFLTLFASLNSHIEIHDGVWTRYDANEISRCFFYNADDIFWHNYYNIIISIYIIHFQVFEFFREWMHVIDAAEYVSAKDLRDVKEQVICHRGLGLFRLKSEIWTGIEGTAMLACRI